MDVNIEQEKKELDAIPKEPIAKFFGSHVRCHICGQIKNASDVKPYDTHVRSGHKRMACSACHPQRGV